MQSPSRADKWNRRNCLASPLLRMNVFYIFQYTTCSKVPQLFNNHRPAHKTAAKGLPSFFKCSAFSPKTGRCKKITKQNFTTTWSHGEKKTIFRKKRCPGTSPPSQMTVILKDSPKITCCLLLERERPTWSSQGTNKKLNRVAMKNTILLANALEIPKSKEWNWRFLLF